MMSGGGLSPDGRHQWDGTEWKPIPPPPRTKMDAHNHFQVFCVFLAVIVVVAILVSAFN